MNDTNDKVSAVNKTLEEFTARLNVDYALATDVANTYFEEQSSSYSDAIEEWMTYDEYVSNH